MSRGLRWHFVSDLANSLLRKATVVFVLLNGRTRQMTLTVAFAFQQM